MVHVSSRQAVVGPLDWRVRAEKSRGTASTGDTQPGHLGVCVLERTFLEHPANHFSVEADSLCLHSSRIFQRPLLLALSLLCTQISQG